MRSSPDSSSRYFPDTPNSPWSQDHWRKRRTVRSAPHCPQCAAPVIIDPHHSLVIFAGGRGFFDLLARLLDQFLAVEEGLQVHIALSA
jgi:hypothetical protein